MTLNWTGEILAQLEFYWDTSLWPRLSGLDDDEYFWEPVDHCWSVRPRPDGTFVADWEWPEPVPPPVTTIAWRLGHIVVGIFELRVDHHFGPGTMTIRDALWPATAEEALDRLQRAYTRWCEGVHALDADALAAPVGMAEPPQWADFPFAALALHINREVIHHGAEIALLRDLYRAHPAHQADAV
ncbi:DinB family protein [Nocardiopsis gilva YIM 90087]|uniref:DinB family protein n=1 Tax=Nocardiopsis gilva YIM 90087 TaxID=1235441 RepID=A0A223S5J8_9ACTN|nr:DinB family protein [Nocardiopsis gilva]ASU83388.1 DinB family protein [Nocardiopsis gilva YIM 90087]